MLQTVLDVLFPLRCLGCGVHLIGAERALRTCASCEHTVHVVESPGCPVCAMPREVRTGIDAVCGRCLERPPKFEAVRARWVYDGAVADAIRRSKTSADPSSMFALIERDRGWFADAATTFADWRWTTPPIHPRDLVLRGWDPSHAALRHAVGSAVEISNPLRKCRQTTKQARLGRAARMAALKGSFACDARISGKWVVFDDVMTTGATIEESARALRRAGAANVIAIVVARAV